MNKTIIWKSRARLIPEGKATLTPENYFILPPDHWINGDGSQ